jgi:transcriptional regulator of acetoin/glycerol metabolism
LARMAAAAGEAEASLLNQSEASERSRILIALEETGGSRILAAKSLGVGRSTLYRRMEKLGIPTRRS